MIRAARVPGFRAAPEDVDTPAKVREASSRLRDETLQRAWQSWQKFAVAYRRVRFHIALPEPDAANQLAGVLTELTGVARMIDTYEPHEQDETSYAPGFRQQAVAARKSFYGFAEGGVTATDPIERKLALTLQALEPVLLRHAESRRP